MSDDTSTDGRQRKERSPSFPFISLRKAVERAQSLMDKHRREPARLSSIATTWDYGLKSSGLLQTVAALKQYGLIDDLGSGDDRKIQLTDLARRILVDQRPGAREAAIKEAARRPRLIAEYLSNWLHDRPSDSHCVSELHLDRGFNPDSAKLFLRVFDETVSYAGLRADESLSKIGTDDDSQTEAVRTEAHPAHSGVGPTGANKARDATLNAGQPFVMSIFDDHIDLSARLDTLEQVDALIRRLQFAKLMLTPDFKLEDDKDIFG